MNKNKIWWRLTPVAAWLMVVSLLGFFVWFVLDWKPPAVVVVFLLIGFSLPDLYLTTFSLWHWKFRYRGAHPVAWAVAFSIFSGYALALFYFYRHINPDRKDKKQYATAATPLEAVRIPQRIKADVRSDRKRMRTILIILAVLVLLCSGAVVIITASRDIQPPDTKDLIPERAELPPEQNAYTYFISATNSFYWPTNFTEYLHGNPADDAVIQETITRNTTTIQAIKRGLECQICLTPEVTGLDTLHPYLSSWLDMGRVMALKIRHDRLAGRYVQATDTCISLLKFADMIQVDAEGFINYLLGTYMLNICIIQAQDLARDKTTPPEELERLSTCLASLRPFAPGLVRAIKVEYKAVANTLDQFRDGKLDVNELFMSFEAGGSPPILKGRRIPAYFFQPNKTKLIFANLFRDMIKNAPLCYADMKQVEKTLWSNADVMVIIQPNVVGRILCAISDNSDGLLERKCQAECLIAATRLLAACNAYQKKRGKLPDDLQSLLPTYLVDIPTDPYDGKPFRYTPSVGIVYSVGKDLKDSGGSSKVPVGRRHSIPEWNAEDIVFEIKAKIEQEN